MNTQQFLANLGILKKEYPKWNAPVLSLMSQTDKNPFKILIATVLSLRTKDQTTAGAAQRLFVKADNPLDMSRLSRPLIERLIYPVGFYRVKAGNIKKICDVLNTVYNSRVPDTLEQLLELDGVGRKTANLVLSLGFDKPAICVDIHVHRISNRFGLIHSKDPLDTEMQLMKMVPKKYWRSINELLVAFGQTICQPVKTHCEKCLVKHCKSRKQNL